MTIQQSSIDVNTAILNDIRFFGQVIVVVHVIVVNLAIQSGSLFLLGFQLVFPFVDVALLVEVREQEQEHDTMKTDPYHETARIIALSEQQLELMCENGNELNHLKGCEILLPPDVFLVFGSQRCNHVVEVHDNVNKCIQHGEECAVSARSEFHSHPHTKWHDAMVNHVEC